MRFFILITTRLLLLNRPFLGMKNQSQILLEDEIVYLEQEIKALEELFLQLVQILPLNRKEKLEHIIHRLQLLLERRKNKRYSQTTREINKVKQNFVDLKSNPGQNTGNRHRKIEINNI